MKGNSWCHMVSDIERWRGGFVKGGSGDVLSCLTAFMTTLIRPRRDRVVASLDSLRGPVPYSSPSRRVMGRRGFPGASP
jgi:hypothetical protein